MSGIKPMVYYWDSCVYLAWLKQEEAYKSALPSIKEILKVNKERKNRIITSTITLIEVLESHLDDDASKEFKSCFKFGDHVIYDVDPPISNKARELRDYYLSNPVDGRTSLSTPDAIHLATAILHNVDEFHTFDNGNTKDGHGKKGIPLLKLGGSVAGNSLAISHPLTEFTPDLLT